MEEPIEVEVEKEVVEAIVAAWGLRSWGRLARSQQLLLLAWHYAPFNTPAVSEPAEPSRR